MEKRGELPIGVEGRKSPWEEDIRVGAEKSRRAFSLGKCKTKVSLSEPEGTFRGGAFSHTP